MAINCSEKCIYEAEGICTLNHITNSSGNNSNNCPYFKDKPKFTLDNALAPPTG